jgi:hypothetical protein
MSLNLKQNIKLTKKNFTNLKYLYKISVLASLCQNKAFVLIFYYDFLDIEVMQKIQHFLQMKNYKSLKLKKNLLRNFVNNGSNVNLFANLLKNNILLIYNKDNTTSFCKSTFYNFSTIKNIHFLGMFQNNIFLRPSEVKIIMQNTSYNSGLKTYSLSNHAQRLLKQTLSLKSFSNANN